MNNFQLAKQLDLGLGKGFTKIIRIKQWIVKYNNRQGVLFKTSNLGISGNVTSSNRPSVSQDFTTLYN